MCVPSAPGLKSDGVIHSLSQFEVESNSSTVTRDVAI
jgi:hypothetical protein